MKVVVLTADSAQVDQAGKVHALGLGWSIVGTPLPAFSVVVLFQIEWHESNETHHFALELVTEDGDIVQIPGGSGSEQAIKIEGDFEQGRPAGIVKGTQLVQPVAITFPPGMPLPAGRRFEFRVAVGEDEGTASFSTVSSTTSAVHIP